MSDKISEKPTVSVVMCTYNGENFLREQLDSILAQTYPIYEIVIQDNGSSDSTMDILHKYAKKYEYIKLYTHIFNLPQKEDDSKDAVRYRVNDNFFLLWIERLEIS
jgi:glycosyltransferase involved in cell wall biosynthesis